MNRTVRGALSVVAPFLLLLAAAPIAGAVAPAPTPGPGAWSAAHPIWFDLNGDGIVQSDELKGYPLFDGYDCTKVVDYPAGLGPKESPCAYVYEDAGIGGEVYRPNGTLQVLYTNENGTGFTYYEEPMAPPGRASSRAGRVKALAPATNGTGLLVDSNGDGIYDTLRVGGTRNGNPVPQSLISLVPKDVTGDGRPDYITVPWTASGAGLLGVFTGGTPQFYFPLTDTNSDGWPDTITAEVANGGMVTTTGPALSGPALVNGIPVPSLSTFGLFALAAAVVAAGIRILRGALVTS